MEPPARIDRLQPRQAAQHQAGALVKQLQIGNTVRTIVGITAGRASTNLTEPQKPEMSSDRTVPRQGTVSVQRRPV